MVNGGGDPAVILEQSRVCETPFLHLGAANLRLVANALSTSSLCRTMVYRC
jgi:hypothetical protein